MSRATDVADAAVLDVGSQYYWAPFPGIMSVWAAGEVSLNDIGTAEESSLNCFAYPMWLAAKLGLLGPASAKAMVGKTRGASDERAHAFSSGFTTQLWTDRPGALCGALGQYWRPSKGDLVFFNGLIGGILAHVAIATGVTLNKTQSEVISFGEGRTTMGQATVNRTTIEALRPGYQSVHFLTPDWM